jgi:hypothetical protein
MKDAYEVLYRKEADLVRVRQEIESLALVASLLADEGENAPELDVAEGGPDKKPSGFEGQAFLPLPGSEATGTDGPSDISGIWRPKKTFWNVLTGRT